MLVKIRLLRRHNGHRKGRVVEVDPLRAERMAKDGIGEYADADNGDGEGAVRNAKE